MPQAWQRTPQQTHRAGNMWSRHGRAAGSGIRIIAGVAGRARAGPRSTNVRLDAVASIDRDGAAAAKASNRVGAGIQCACRIRGRIERGWI